MLIRSCMVANQSPPHVAIYVDAFLVALSCMQIVFLLLFSHGKHAKREQQFWMPLFLVAPLLVQAQFPSYLAAIVSSIVESSNLNTYKTQALGSIKFSSITLCDSARNKFTCSFNNLARALVIGLDDRFGASILVACFVVVEDGKELGISSSPGYEKTWSKSKYGESSHQWRSRSNDDLLSKRREPYPIHQRIKSKGRVETES